MNDLEKRKIQNEVLNFITLALRTEGIELLTMTLSQVDLVIRCFQLGVEFTEKKRKEIEEMNEIPF